MDCLSEGINLQEHFDSVVHYDLSWNPTRHEQREGRVDRYGQPRKTVRALTLFSMDNRIDGLVLDVLLRKHRIIRSGLGISVPVPVRSEEVMEALMQGLILRGKGSHDQQYLGVHPLRGCRAGTPGSQVRRGIRRGPQGLCAGRCGGLRGKGK